jgi:mutator protein MutT
MGKVVTLLFLRRGEEILLAMKKRGFGAGKWNGVGGKLEPGETLEQAVVRECQEEINVTPVQFHKVAEHDFQEFHDGQPAHMLVHAYLCEEWEGEPAESEEMAPRWFKLTDIPYADMWEDDPHWLPQVLKGKLLKTTFQLDKNNKIVDKTVTPVQQFVS